MLKERSVADEVCAASIASAEEAGLRFVADDEPGISRHRSGTSFGYKSSGAVLKDERTLARIRGLVITPAWTEVWILSQFKNSKEFLADGSAWY